MRALAHGGQQWSGELVHMRRSPIIQRMPLRKKLSVRDSARRTGRPRNTVSQYLAANTIEPRFTASERPSVPDPFSKECAGQQHSRKSRKSRRTLRWLYADTVNLGSSGPYSRVAIFARNWRWTVSMNIRRRDRARPTSPIGATTLPT